VAVIVVVVVVALQALNAASFSHRANVRVWVRPTTIGAWRERCTILVVVVVVVVVLWDGGWVHSTFAQ